MFWVFVAPEFIAVVPFIWKFGLISTHTIPLVLIVTHLFLTNARLRIKDWWHSFAITAAYSCVNYTFTRHLGAPVYPFLTWEDIPISAWYCFLGWAFGYVCVVFTVTLHSKLSPRQY